MIVFFFSGRYRYTVHPDGQVIHARQPAGLPKGVRADYGYPKGVGGGADYPMDVRNNRKVRLYHPSYPGQQEGDFKICSN